MKKPKLVTFRYRLPALDQRCAWGYARKLAGARGNREPPPTRYRVDFILIRIHPDDEPAMTEFCRLLDLAAGRAPWR